MSRLLPPFARVAVCCLSIALMGQTPTEQEFNEQAEMSVCDLNASCYPGRTVCDQGYTNPSESRANCTYDANAAQDCLAELETATCNDFFTAVYPAPTCSQVYDCDPCDVGDELTDTLTDLSVHLTGNPNTLCGWLDRDVSSEPTVLGDPGWGSVSGAGDYSECHGVVAEFLTLSPADAQRIDQHYPCGLSYYGFTLCGNPSAPLEDGDYVLIVNVLKGDFPLDDTTHYYQLGFPIDPDDDPNNNYEPQAPFLGDFYANMQWFFELSTISPGSWGFGAVDATNNQFQALESSARGSITGNLAFMLIPRSELSGQNIGYRVTFHEHNGDFGENGDTKADTERPINESPQRIVGESSADPDGGVPDGGAPDAGAPDAGDPDAGAGESDGGSSSGCGVASPESPKSTLVLALFLASVAFGRRIRRRRHRH